VVKIYFKYFFQVPFTEMAQIPVREKETSIGSHPMSCSMGTRVLSQGIKQLGCEFDHLPHFVPRLRICGDIGVLTPVCLHGVDREDFTFLFYFSSHTGRGVA
jgi:hypothetical protein